MVGVLCNPDRARGRKRVSTPPEVARTAIERTIALLQPERLDADARRAVAALRPELLVSFAYGRIFGPRFLTLFPSGGINVHPSLLPRFRGPSPIEAAILAGDAHTGVSVQELSREVDSGAILAQRSLPLCGRETAVELAAAAALLGAELVGEVIEDLRAARALAREQDHAVATYCRVIAKRDGAIDWGRDAGTLARMVRAYTPWPGVRCRFDGRDIAVTAAAVHRSDDAITTAAPPGTILSVDSRAGILVQTGFGVLAVRRVKPAARAEQSYRDFANGVRGLVGRAFEPA